MLHTLSIGGGNPLSDSRMFRCLAGPILDRHFATGVPKQDILSTSIPGRCPSLVGVVTKQTRTPLAKIEGGKANALFATRSSACSLLNDAVFLY